MAGWFDVLGVFDLETTGIDPSESRIVSAYLGVLDADGAVVGGRTWLADPEIDIPDEAAAVHGITTERARAEGRPAREVVGELLDAVRGLLVRNIPVVVYNAPYDLSLLNAEASRHRLDPLLDPAPIIDPFVIDRAVDSTRAGKRTLVAAAEHYGVTLEDAHDAASDAIAAGRVALAIADAFPAELNMPELDLHDAQARWFRDQAAEFQEYVRAKHGGDYVAPTEWPVRTEGAAR